MISESPCSASHSIEPLKISVCIILNTPKLEVSTVSANSILSKLKDVKAKDINNSQINY